MIYIKECPRRYSKQRIFSSSVPMGTEEYPHLGPTRHRRHHYQTRAPIPLPNTFFPHIYRQNMPSRWKCFSQGSVLPVPTTVLARPVDTWHTHSASTPSLPYAQQYIGIKRTRSTTSAADGWHPLPRLPSFLIKTYTKTPLQVEPIR